MQFAENVTKNYLYYELEYVTFHSHFIITDTAYNTSHKRSKDLNFAARNEKGGIILVNQTGNTKMNEETSIRDLAIN